MKAQLHTLLLWLCTTTLLLLSATPTPANGQQNCGLRIRRAWSSLSDADQTLYKNALAASMDSGMYIKFIEMHTEMMSTTEAHKSCMFIYWHRLFLAVFENMLRGQGPQYACITVPYWDWISDYNRFVNRECTSMLSCSRALQALGGVTGSTKVFLRINGVQTSGNCSTTYPLNHFCHAGNVTGSQCVRCVTRGPWDTKYLPASASYASVRSQLFAANNINDMSTAVETGVHNNIHAALDGAMATFASPADPIFWSHHAMVDLLHTIFHKCRVGEQMMTLAQKVASPIGWNSCKRQNGTAFSPYDNVMMRTGAFGQNPLNGSLDPLIGKYFSDLPQQFAALMDHNDLGSSSYLYLYQGLLGEMYNKCGNSTSNAAAVLALTPAPTAMAPAEAMMAPTPAPIPAPTPAPTTKVPVVPSAPTPAPTIKPQLLVSAPTPTAVASGISSTPAPTPATRPPTVFATPTPTPTTAPTTRPPVVLPPPTTSPTPAPTTKPPVLLPTPTPTPAPTTRAPTVPSTPVPTTRAPVLSSAPIVPPTPTPITRAPTTLITTAPISTTAPSPVPTTRAPTVPSTVAPMATISLPVPIPAPTTQTPGIVPISSPTPTSFAPIFFSAPTPAPTTKAPFIWIAPVITPSPAPAPTTSTPFAWPFLTPVPATRAPTPAPAPTTRVPTPAPAPTTAALISSPSSAITAFQQRKLQRRLDDPETSPANGNQNIVIVAAVNTTLDVSAQIVSYFISNMDEFLAARLGDDVDQVDEQEKMACMFQDECLGGVKDYSEAFKRDFKVYGKPRCKEIVDQIRAGKDCIALPSWKETMMKSFGCPIPTAH